MSKSFLNALDSLGDKRRTQGKRHSQVHIIVMLIMANMSGYQGYRGLEDFIIKNRKDLIRYLKPKKDRLPSLSTVFRVVREIDFDQLSKILSNHLLRKVTLPDEPLIHIDGKGLKNSIVSTFDSHQNFATIATAFSSELGIALISEKYESKKSSEVSAVEKILKALDIKEAIITADDLHTTKKTFE